VTLAPILSASSAMQIHIAAVAGAFLIGTWMMMRPKGTRPHRTLGPAFMVLMMVGATSAFWIQHLNKGNFSFLHLLSIFVLVTVPYGWLMARRGNVRAHRFTMIGLYFGGLWIPGALAFLPGRVLHRALFG
jgi:uncharacterized membrane protein